MDPRLIGTWISKSSDIPGYRPGSERLRFAVSGEHEREVSQLSGVGRSVVTRFTATAVGDSLLFCSINSIGHPLEWLVCVEVVNEGAITVRPQHGFTTVFVHEQSPNQQKGEGAGE